MKLLISVFLILLVHGSFAQYPRSTWEQKRIDAERNLQYQRELNQITSQRLTKAIEINNQCIIDTKLTYAGLKNFPLLSNGKHYAQAIVTMMNGDYCRRVMAEIFNGQVVKVTDGENVTIPMSAIVNDLKARASFTDDKKNLILIDLYFIYE